MKTIVRVLATLFLLSISGQPSFAQNDNLKVEHISLEQGVSNNLIFSIYQDSKGFIWFGTMFGLVKYDGVNYKTYRHDPLDSNSLSNDDIISIYEDKSGNLWLGTFNGGLNKYDRKTGIFTRYLHNPDNPNTISSNTVWDIIQDKSGAMWFGTDGGGLSKFENNTFITYKKDSTDKESISGNFIRSLAEDKDGNIWAGTMASGLNKFDKEKNSFTNFRNEPGNEKSLGNNFVTSIFEDGNGELWIGTGGGGLNKFDKSTGEFKRYTHDSTNQSSISSSYVFSIGEDSPGYLLVGTQKGLNKFDISSEKFERLKIYTKEENKRETVLKFTKDKSGVIWVSTYLDGLHKLFYPVEKFKAALEGKNVKCIFEDKSGRIWYGTESDGLLMSDDGGKNFRAFLNDKNNRNSIWSNNVNSIAEDKKGYIWVGTSNGLNKIENNLTKFTKYFSSEKNETPKSGNVLKIYFDKEGELWIGTDNGLNKFINESQSYTPYKNSDNAGNFSDNSILSIYEDKDGVLWFGTYYGLNKLDKATGNISNFAHNSFDLKSISNNYVFSFCEDSNNNFWIGTGGGLNIFDRNRKTFFHFTKRDGLPNEVIAGIEYSDDGHLWLSTFKGISRFDIRNKEFKNYDSQEGLLSNLFNQGSYYKRRNGEILFGGINGVTIINPSMIKESKFIPDIILTSLEKYNGKDKCDIDISMLSDLELSYKDNMINIGYTSNDFTNPGKNKFAYMLEGFDKDWIYSGNSTKAIYTNLDLGEFVFKVKGTNSDGVWNGKESLIKIIVTPPFWKTWWFYGILICLLIGSIFLIHRYSLRKKIRYLLQLEKIKERERELMREQASRDYHDELGHKLTRISLYSRRINKKLRPTANGLTNDLNSIVETSNSLQSGAKDLIWAMNPQEDSFYDFTIRLKDFGNELFENTGITFSAEGITEEFREIILSMISKRHLIYIFKEGMNNILKYSRCSKVDLIFSMYDDHLEILLKDNGIGFDPENCPKGYGLKNIFSRAAQINVNVNISSEENSGTEIKLKTKTSNLLESIE
ncbi:MAG: histidine kinase [Bacteroidota bacterium]|nr:histidine kinase [Bacteroidota bacterium]